MPTLSTDEQAVLTATKDLLVAIDSGDYATYEKLCSLSMTSFEGETKGHLAEGLAFHKYYFDMAVTTSIRMTHVYKVTISAKRQRLS